jgi:hypothetical protein
MNRHQRAHLFFAPLGLSLIGAGLCLAIDTGINKSTGTASLFDNWIVGGALALIMFNSGLCLFGRAIIEKIKADRA